MPTYQVQNRTFDVISGWKYDAAWVVAKFNTLGKVVLPGESEDHHHVFPPSRRSRIALEIIELIRTSRDGLRRLMLSPSTYHMACSIVGRLGQSNIGRAQVALGLAIEQVKVPASIIPLAATFVSHLQVVSQISSGILIHGPWRVTLQVEQELYTVGDCEDEVDGRSGSFGDFLAFSESDRTTYRKLETAWSDMHIRNPQVDPEITTMLGNLRTELNIAKATNRYKNAQAEQLNPVAREGRPLLLLPTLALRDPPRYSAEGSSQAPLGLRR